MGSLKTLRYARILDFIIYHHNYCDSGIAEIMDDKELIK